MTGHELSFDRTDEGHQAICSCGWMSRCFGEVNQAHLAGAWHWNTTMAEALAEMRAGLEVLAKAVDAMAEAEA